MEEQQVKKSSKKKWILISILAVLGAGILAWVLYNAIAFNQFDKIFDFKLSEMSGTNPYSLIGLLLGIFIIIGIGNLLGRITIKGVSLGTAGIFLVAILFGFLFTLIPSDMTILNVFSVKADDLVYFLYDKVIMNLGLVLFVGAVGFIAGPKFFRNLKKNGKSYGVLGAIIIFTGVIIAICFALIPGIGAEYSMGILSGALTTTPGYAAAKAAAEVDTYVTLGHAVAYPFGVIGVVLFVQLIPKFMKADMNKERQLLATGFAVEEESKPKKKLFTVDEYGITPFAIAVILGLILGTFKIPLNFDKGFAGTCFSLGNTGGVLIMCLVMGHFGRMGKMSMEMPEKTSKVFREWGLILFLIGAGVAGGVKLVDAVADAPGGAMTVVYGFLAGIVMTIVPMIVGFFFAKKVLKLPLLNNLGSITGGMTSTPALGTLIGVSKTDDVAAAYASTYPIALVLIVLASQLVVSLL